MITFADIEAPAAAAWAGLTTVHAAASFIDAALPQPVSGSKWITIRKVISTLAINVSNARNLVQPGSTTASVVSLIGGMANLAATKPPSATVSPAQFKAIVTDTKPSTKTEPVATTAAAKAASKLPPFVVSDLMPTAKPVKASAPAATGSTSTGTRTMSFLSSMEEAWSIFETVFSATKQASVSGDVTSLINTVGSTVSTLTGVASLAVAALPVNDQAGAANAVKKVSQTLGAITSASPATSYAGLVSDATAAVNLMPIGTEDKQHAQVVLSALGMATSFLSGMFSGDPAKAAVTPAAAS